MEMEKSKVRLSTRPSIHNNKDLEQSGATGTVESIDSATFQKVRVKLQTSGSGPLRVNGALDAPLTFDATNWDKWQDVSLTAVGGQGTTAFVTVAIDQTVERFDTFFANAAPSVPIIVPIAPASELAISAQKAAEFEGNMGTTNFLFSVSRSVNTSGTTQVNYAVTGTNPNPANAADFVNGVFPQGSITFGDAGVQQNHQHRRKR